jgi:hypothetical protein
MLNLLVFQQKKWREHLDTVQFFEEKTKNHI